MFDHGETVIRLRAPLAADPYSVQATVRDWPNAASVALEGFAIDPGTSNEFTTVNRTQITTTPTLYGPYGADVLASDRVRDEAGTTWEVVGNRSDWRNPYTGWLAGASWPLKRVEG